MADFAISDKAFDKFLIDLAEAAQIIDPYAESDLMTARTLLDNFMTSAQFDETIDQGPGEVLAACFIWNFFNTHPDAARVIEGDIMIVDLDGTLSCVEFVSAQDSQTTHKHEH